MKKLYMNNLPMHHYTTVFETYLVKAVKQRNTLVLNSNNSITKIFSNQIVKLIDNNETSKTLVYTNYQI